MGRASRSGRQPSQRCSPRGPARQQPRGRGRPRPRRPFEKGDGSPAALDRAHHAPLWRIGVALSLPPPERQAPNDVGSCPAGKERGRPCTGGKTRRARPSKRPPGPLPMGVLAAGDTIRARLVHWAPDRAAFLPWRKGSEPIQASVMLVDAGSCRGGKPWGRKESSPGPSSSSLSGGRCNRGVELPPPTTPRLLPRCPANATIAPDERGTESEPGRCPDRGVHAIGAALDRKRSAAGSARRRTMACRV